MTDMEAETVKVPSTEPVPNDVPLPMPDPGKYPSLPTAVTVPPLMVTLPPLA